MESLVQKFFFNHYPKNIAQCVWQLETEVEKNCFTAWSFANSSYKVSAFWADEYCLDKKNLHPIFDLASLTKPLFLNLYFFLKFKTSYFYRVNQPLHKWFDVSKIISSALSEYIRAYPELSLNSFLNHQSGLRPWHWLGFPSVLEMTEYALKERISPDKTQIYSDLNYFLLARILEPHVKWEKVLSKINKKTGADFAHASILSPRKSIPFFPYSIIKNEHEVENECYGFPHDTNANMFASRTQAKIVSGHAGLFGTVEDISKALEYLLKKKFFYQFEIEKKKNNSRFIYGYDTPSSPNSTAGLHQFYENKNKVFGHLGYSGSSFWVNQQFNKFHVLLTNRTAKRNENIPLENRIYIVEDNKKSKVSCFLRNRELLEEYSLKDMIQFNNNIFKSNKLFWNKTCIPDYCDLSLIRKDVGLNLWGL